MEISTSGHKPQLDGFRELFDHHNVQIANYRANFLGIFHLPCFRQLRFTALALCFLSLMPAWAQRGYEPPVSIQRERSNLIINADGTYREVTEQAVRIRTAPGAEQYASQEISYIAGREEILDVEGWTLTPDGTKLPVLPAAIRDRDEDNSGGTAQFSDSRVKVIIFPRVTVGSVVTYKVDSKIVASLYPGEFNRSFVFHPSTPYENWELQIAIPASRPLYIDKRGVEGGLDRTVDGIAHYVFKYRREKTEPPLSGAAGLLHRADYLQISTMADMGALGRIARGFFESRVEVSDDIRSLALTLTAGATTERAKAKALYEWVTREIRYVSISLGDGRLVPHPASQVLQNRYGDCKDHVVLLEALLRAVGIESSPALISSSSTQRLSAVGAHYPLNHVITYIPSLDLYLDSTDRFATFGTLPTSDADKPVLLLNLDRMGRTPPLKAEDHVSRTRVRMTIRSDGSIQGAAHTRQTGFFANSSRSMRFDDRSRAEDEVVRSQLARFNETGSGRMRFTDPTDIAQPFGLSSAFMLEPLVNMPGRGALAMPVGLAPGNIAYIAVSQPEPVSDRPVLCSSRTVHEHYTLTFPTNVVVEEVPKGIRFVRGDIQYESRLTHAGRTVTVDRHLRIQRASRLCGLKEARDWDAFYRALQRDLRAQILFR